MTRANSKKSGPDSGLIKTRMKSPFTADMPGEGTVPFGGRASLVINPDRFPSDRPERPFPDPVGFVPGGKKK